MRRNGKVWLKKALSHLSPLLLGRDLRRVVVLCYHSVHPHKRFASATPELFTRHLEWLREHCDLIPFAAAPGDAARRARARPAVAITFDDGYEDNHQYALPILSGLGVPATLFVTVGFIERIPGVIGRFRTLRRCNADDVRPLSWSQLKELRAAGLTIGAHTYTHPNLARMRARDAEEELSVARWVLEERLGERVHLMAYPFGKPRWHFTGETMTLVSRAGYEYAAAIGTRAVQPSDPLLAIPRFSVAGDDLGTLAQKVFGAWDLIGLWADHAPLWAARLISPEDFAV